MNLFRNECDEDKYFIATYWMQSKTNLRNGAWNLAIGQSVGNPNVRNHWESDELFENHSCLILHEEGELKEYDAGYVRIAFPLVNLNIDEDGISQLLVMVMGGQMDIDDIMTCRLVELEFPSWFVDEHFKGPRHGIEGIREYTGVHGKPLLGGIVKPKIGVDPQTLKEMVVEMVEGGVNFIKEDEILSNPAFCKLEERLPPIMDYIRDKGVIYAPSITCDPAHVVDRVKKVVELGGHALHINFWAGMGVYKSIRDLDLPIFLFFQKSGDKILTDKNHRFSISWDVVCQLAGMSGVDFIHAGMWGGYMDEPEEALRTTLDVLHGHGVMPSLSCGMHAGLVDAITERFGIDYMANVGGAIHGHPMGSKAGVLAMRQSIDGNHGEEYKVAIEKWGKV